MLLQFYAPGVMDIKFEKTEECEGTIRTYAGAAEVAEKRKEILKRFARGARIPGFRPGKAPMSVIIKHFQKDADDVLLTRLSDESFELIHNLNSDVTLVNISKSEINVQEDGSYELFFHVSFVPPFDIPRYEDIEVSQGNCDVNEEEVTDFLRDVAQSEATYTEVDRPATAGDRVTFDFNSTVEGKTPSEFCGRDLDFVECHNDYALNLNDSSVLSKGLVGAVVGEDRVIDFVPDENFHIPELRGKHVLYSCKIKKIQSIQVSNIESEAFVSAHNAPDRSTLRARIRAILETSKKRADLDAQRVQISDFIASHVNFPLPQQLIETQAEAVLERSRTSVPANEMTRDEARKEAVRILHTYFTLCTIAEKESLVATDHDLAQRITEMALSEGESNLKSFTRKLQGEGRLNIIRSTATVDKTLDFLLKKVRVVPSAESPLNNDVSSDTSSAAESEAQTDASPEVSPTEVTKQQ